MSTTFQGSAIWHDTITGPANGEVASGASVTDMGVLLQDNARYLLERIGAGGYISVPLNPLENLNARWTWNFTNKGWRQTTVTDGGRLTFAFQLPPVGKITKLRIARDGNGGGSNHTLFPVRPQYALHYLNGTIIDTGEIFDNADTAGDVATYETRAAIEYTLVGSHTILTDEIYYLSIVGESGANAIANALEVYDASVFVTAV